jgi:hypothetical protein
MSLSKFTYIDRLIQLPKATSPPKSGQSEGASDNESKSRSCLAQASGSENQKVPDYSKLLEYSKAVLQRGYLAAGRHSNRHT